MNTLCLPKSIRVLSTDNDSGMLRLQIVQFDEITPVERKHRSVVLCSESEHLDILNGLSGFARFQGSQNIMTQTTQCFHNLTREVFIRI